MLHAMLPRASAPRASAPRASAPRASAPRASAPRASALKRRALKERARARASQRGTAMVEGAFLSIIFALIFNLCVFSSGMYMAKIESAQVARYSAFYFATHNCAGSVPSYKTPKFPVQVTPGARERGEPSGAKFPDSSGSDPQVTDGSQMQGSGKGGTNTDGFIVCVTAKSTSTWAWNRPSWYANALSGNADVTSISCVMCNEKAYGVNVLSFLGTLLSQLWKSIF